MRRAAKKDANHNEIADFLRKKGWSVLDLSRVGSGVPDMAVGKPGFAALVECKQEKTAEAALKALTKDERKVYDEWEGPYVIAIDPEQADLELTVQMALWRVFRGK